MHPILNLVVAAAISALAVLLVLLLRPERGWLWRWLPASQAAQRVRIEDALKHFYECEYSHLPATLSSLAGALEIRRDDAARLSARLESLGQIVSKDDGFQLSDTGRSDALRVIRIHRLWECYLAERTGIEESEWHHQADRKEHLLTADQVARLSASLGNPTYDPHGDPIPTDSGRMPERRGLPLSSLRTGATARIVHVEDEPDAVYAQLIAARLFPGVTLRVLESNTERIRIEAELQEHVLALVVAANLTVEPIGDWMPADAPDRRLSELARGESGTVVGISPACRAIDRRRLLDLGVVPGTVITAEFASMSGDPMAYRIRGALMALRREQAELIHLRSQAKTLLGSTV